MCVRIAYVCLSAWLLLVSARLVYLSLLPLSAKRLNPRRPVTVLFVRRVFSFPPARVTKLLWLALPLGLERNKPEMPLWGEGKWQSTKKKKKDRTGSLDGKIFFCSRFWRGTLKYENVMPCLNKELAFVEAQSLCQYCRRWLNVKFGRTFI